MNSRRVAVILLVLAPFATVASWAAPQHARDGAGAERQQGLSPEQAARIARGRGGGRVLSVQPTQDGFRVKMLTPQGEVRYVPVRAGRR